MPSTLSAKVTLHNSVTHTIKAGDVLVVAVDCIDESDKQLMTSKPKHLKHSDLVIVQDYYTTSDKTFSAVRIMYDNKLYYLASSNLTILALL